MPSCLNPRCQADYLPGTFQCSSCQCLLPGAVVAKRYRVESLVGRGGMGAVYQASDLRVIMQKVAIKVIFVDDDRIETATAVARFRREARYADQLQHKNIVPLLDFGQDGSLLYFVMLLVTGGTLKALLQAQQPLPLALTQRYVNELADAIDVIHAHQKQIVHRDIKPSNLLIHQDDGRLLIADFGIARAMRESNH